MSYCPFTGDDCIHVHVLQYDCKVCDCYIIWKNRCTCNECEDQLRCPVAFDLYNTDGDCLMMK